MHVLALEAQASWRILLVALVLGAGLPALFSVGVRAMAAGAGGDAEVHGGDTAGPPAHPAARVLAIAIFVVVLAVVALGIAYVVGTGFGYKLSFAHVYPTFSHS